MKFEPEIFLSITAQKNTYQANNQFLVDTDDLMAQTYSNEQGYFLAFNKDFFRYFETYGVAHEFLSIDAKVNIYHNCDRRIMVKAERII